MQPNVPSLPASGSPVMCIYPGKLLLRLPEVIHRMTEDLLLHSLCEFMYEVANVFTGTSIDVLLNPRPWLNA